MRANEVGMTDYRCMNVIFDGGMRLSTLELHLFEHQLATLIKTVDFLRMQTVQRLEVLKLRLVCTELLRSVRTGDFRGRHWTDLTSHADGPSSVRRCGSLVFACCAVPVCFMSGTILIVTRTK